MSTHDSVTSLVFVIDNLTSDVIEYGQDVHAPTWSGTLVGLARGCYVQVMDRTGRTETYHPSLFELTVSAMADCGCSVTNGIVCRDSRCTQH